MGLFSKKKKTFADRFPAAKSAYDLLSNEQKRVLDDFSALEKSHLKEDKRVGLERIVGTYLVPKLGGSLSAKELRRRSQLVYDGCLTALRAAPLTVNVDAKLFSEAYFLQGTEVKTVFTTKAKDWKYHQHRHAVEANAFGFKIDWSVPIQRAAEARPIYAGLNFSQHPYGAAEAYGSVALVLKPTVRDRCTFINTDTFGDEFKFADGSDAKIAESRNKICTAAQMDTLLAHISNNQLKALCQVAESAYVIGDYPPNYIEAHVYGGIQWARDLEAISINKAKFVKEAGLVTSKIDLATLKANVIAFAAKYSVSAKMYKLDKVEDVLRA
jgi:hypothetical protein